MHSVERRSGGALVALGDKPKDSLSAMDPIPLSIQEPGDPALIVFQRLMEINSGIDEPRERLSLSEKEIIRLWEKGANAVDLSFFIGEQEEVLPKITLGFKRVRSFVHSAAIHEIGTSPDSAKVQGIRQAFGYRDLTLASYLFASTSKGGFTPLEVFAMERVLSQECPVAKLLYYILKNDPKQARKIVENEKVSEKERMYCICFAKLLAKHNCIDNREILEIFQRYYPEEYEVEPRYTTFKLASLILNIPPTGFSVGHVQVSKLGYLPENMVFTAKELFSGFMGTPMASSLSRDITSPLKDMCDNRLTLDKLLEASKYKPILLGSGWRGHSTYVVVYKNIFIKCNRGNMSGDKPGLRVLSFDRDALTTELMAEIVRHQEKNVFNKVMERKLRAKFVLYIPQKHQKSGNCTWASIKSAIFGLIFIDKLQKITDKTGAELEDLNQEERAELIQDSRKVYKNFTHFSRIQAKVMVDQRSFPTPLFFSEPFYRLQKFRQLWKLQPLPVA